MCNVFECFEPKKNIELFIFTHTKKAVAVSFVWFSSPSQPCWYSFWAFWNNLLHNVGHPACSLRCETKGRKSPPNTGWNTSCCSLGLLLWAQCNDWRRSLRPTVNTSMHSDLLSSGLWRFDCEGSNKNEGTNADKNNDIIHLWYKHILCCYPNNNLIQNGHARLSLTN